MTLKFSFLDAPVETSYCQLIPYPIGGLDNLSVRKVHRKFLP